ncbi:MAG TPA: carbonic anhydrase [Chloroflexia bacterium]|nr:carbonic anhydrase [Chloroflexia bacterium]
MSSIATLTERNTDFAAHHFTPGLPIIPALRTLIISCADARVDPAHLLELQPGEALVIRNIGGRINPPTLQAIAMLGAIARVEGADPSRGFNLIVLHHTDCGITRLENNPTMLSGFFGIPAEDLPARVVGDPRSAVAGDVAALRANPDIPATWTIAGMVYDVETGLVETVVPLAPLRG